MQPAFNKSTFSLESFAHETIEELESYIDACFYNMPGKGKRKRLAKQQELQGASGSDSIDGSFSIDLSEIRDSIK